MPGGLNYPLSLADLEAYDPHAPVGGHERRFLCPFCGDDKPKNAAHRSLSLNSEQGAFYCYRCGAGGKLTDFWQERPVASRRARAREQLNRVCALPPITPKTPKPDKVRDLRAQLHDLQPLANAPGAAYLTGRGVSLDVCHAAGARFATNWLGRPAIVFPLRDRDGALVAAQGRYTDERDNPKARTLGDKKAGLFVAHGAWDVPALIVCEAPIDALSLATAGFAALALCGTAGPDWLPKACAFRRVLLGFDADDAGDRAAVDLAPMLAGMGARGQRLRPEGVKDWNEFLQTYGRDALADFLAAPVLMEE